MFFRSENTLPLKLKCEEVAVTLFDEILLIFVCRSQSNNYSESFFFLQLHLQYFPLLACSRLARFVCFCSFHMRFLPRVGPWHLMRWGRLFVCRSAWSATRRSRRCVIKPLPVVVRGARVRNQRGSRSLRLSVSCLQWLSGHRGGRR